jgi:hypothetical protein
MPPSSTPAAPPAPAIAPQMPSALLRSAPSVNVVVTIASAAGERADEESGARREPAGERGGGEQRHAGDEHLAAAEQVGGAAAEEQEAAEGQRVGVDDPLQVVLGEVQRVLDRRQRDVHDRRVEDDHELDRREEHQGAPAAGIGSVAGHCAPPRLKFLCHKPYNGDGVPVPVSIRNPGSACQRSPHPR